MRLKGILPYLALLLPACDSPADPGALVSSVRIRPDTNLALLTASEFKLSAEVTGTDGTPVSDVRVTWKSASPEFATVDSAGLVRAAATYAPCWAIDRPGSIRASFCRAQIIATVGARSDSVWVGIKPRFMIHDTLSVTLAVGDSTPLVMPYGTVDGQRVCPYGPFALGFISGTGGVIWRGVQIVGLKPGEVRLTWVGPVPHLCFDNYSVVTTIQVVAR